MKRFILFAFVFALDCHGSTYCPEYHKRSNGVCCRWHYYYNTVAKSCKPCNCDSIGAKGGKKGECDDENGHCFCYKDYKGSECQHCIPGHKKSNDHCCELDWYYATWDNKCRSCGCTEPGSKGGRKAGCSETGWCYCYPYYAGSECEKCEKGSIRSNGHCCPLDYYYATWNKRCRWCACHEIGAKGGKKGGCDKHGYCYCKANRKGPECQHCVKGLASNGHCCASDSYYNLSYKKCRTCKCEEPGSKGGKKGGCDGNGECYCYTGYAGYECQRCAEGYKRSNGYCCKNDHYYHKRYGCLPCRCEIGAKGGAKGECDSYGWCYCREHFKGSECQECENGLQISNAHCCKRDQYYATWDNKCRDCRCDEIGAKGGEDGGCNEGGYCYCYKDYAGSECQRCKPGQRKTNGHCCLYNHYYHRGTRKCRPCRCEEPGSKGGTGGACDDNGNCYCYDDYAGSECQKCKQGRRRSNDHCCLKSHYYHVEKGTCLPCDCHQRGATGGKKEWDGKCDPSTGKCDCNWHYDGLRCEECKSGRHWTRGHCCPTYCTWDGHCKRCCFGVGSACSN